MASPEKTMAQIMGQKHRQKYLYDVVKLLPSHTSVILDAGCGTGVFLRPLVEFDHGSGWSFWTLWLC